MKKKSKTVPVVVTIVIVVGAIAYLMFSSFGESMIYYKTVNELLAEPARFTDRPVRVNGVVMAGSVKQKPGTNQYRFEISKRDKVLEVEYAGILPDAMQPGREIVIQGVLQTDHRRFIASEILTKCPSKHEAKAEAAGR